MLIMSDDAWRTEPKNNNEKKKNYESAGILSVLLFFRETNLQFSIYCWVSCLIWE